MGPDDKGALTDEAPGPATDIEVELVTAARAGSHDAFRELVQLHQTMIFSLAYSGTGSLAESDEVVQQTFITAWEKLPRLSAPGSFRAWLCGITRNMVRRFMHQQRRRQRKETQLTIDEEREPSSSEPSPLERVITREEHRDLQAALQRMPERYRVPLLLHYQEQLSVEQTAEGLGIQPASAKQRLRRGRRMLEGRLLLLAKSGRHASRVPAKITAAIMAAVAVSAARDASAAPRSARWTAVRMSLPKPVLLAGVLALGGALLLVGATPWIHTGGRRATMAAASFAPETPSLHAWVVTRRPRLPSFTTAEAAPLVASTVERPPVAILDFDFEDGAMPAVGRFGHVAACPTRPDNSFCFVAGLTFWKTTEGEQRVAWQAGLTNANPHLFRYSRTQTLSFDYFLDSDEGSLQVKIAQPDYRQYRLEVPEGTLVRKAWTRVQWPLSRARELVGDTLHYNPPEAGNAIAGVTVFGGAGPLYIDNFRVADTGPAP